MIVLNYTASTYVALSLAERTTITNPYYVFKFVDGSGNQKIFSASDVSLYTGRTSIFSLTVTGSTSYENLSAGTIYMANNNGWDYYIYQTSLPNQTTLDNIVAPNSSFDFIEQGQVYVKGLPKDSFDGNQYELTNDNDEKQYVLKS